MTMPRRPFHTASDAEIKRGDVSDVYFERTVEILRHRNDRKRVKAEVYVKSLPDDWQWGVLAGIHEAAALLEGVPVTARAMDEGTLFGPYQPVLTLEGTYVEWARYETALLGLICQASGIATKAARCKKAAGERQVISFGARRMHPTIAPMIERNAFIGGCDGVAVTKSAELIDADPMGTIPHSLVLMVGDTVEALRAFHEVIDAKVRRVALIDTLQDEKFEAIRVAEALGGDLYAVRLDTPSSRRGDFFRIIQEVRWELDIRGYGHVKIIASGGVDEYEILHLNPVVDAYGVGTSIANAPVLNFALDIMEIEGRPMAKRGKWSGAKDVLRCRACHATVVVPAGRAPAPCSCGEGWEPLLRPLATDGRVVRDLPPPRTIRDHVLEQLGAVPLDTIRRAVPVPLLRKDFTLAEYQLWESRAAGADAVLLIVSILEASELRDLLQAAKGVGLAALVECHTVGELETALAVGARVVGINNRDLTTFNTRIETTLELLPRIPPGHIVVSESGFFTGDQVKRVAVAGAHAVLVGEALVTASDVPAKIRELRAVEAAGAVDAASHSAQTLGAVDASR